MSRAIYPEHILLGRADKLHLGHLTTAIDSGIDVPNERIGFLDYMPPEMLAIKVCATRQGSGAGGEERAH